MEGGRALSPQARRVLEQYKDTPPPPTVKKKESKRVWFLSKAKRPGQRGTDVSRIHPAPQPLLNSTNSSQQSDQQQQHDDLPSFAPAISPLLTQRSAAAQGWPSEERSHSSGEQTRDRSNTSAPPVDYVHAPTSRLMGMFEQPLESRYREYWQQSYTTNARRGITAALVLSFVFGVLGDANNLMWQASTEFIHLLVMRLCGLAVVSFGLVLFRNLQPGQWGYSVWPRWSTPVHLVAVLFVAVFFSLSSVAAVHHVLPDDVSLNLSYSLLLILLPSQCATLLHVNHALLAVICLALLVTSIVLTCLYTSFDLVLLVVYAIAVSCSHAIYIIHAHRENTRTRQEFLSFCHLQQEEEVNQRLLLKMLPLSIIHKLRGGAEYVYEKYERVSVLFSHIDDFDLHTASMQPIQLVRTLNKLFSLFDALTDEHRVYKVETIGDVFLVSSGCPAEYARDDHASALCVLAVDMMAVVKAFKVRHDETRRTSIRLMNAVPSLFSLPSVSASLDDDRPARSMQTYSSSSSNSSTTAAASSRLSHSSLDLRIGINTGPVIAGVVGVKYPRYRLMGDTINTASRMSTTCERGEIQLSSATYGDLNAADFVCQQRSRVEVKGKGLMQTYILQEHKLCHRTSATKVVQAKLGVANEQPQQHLTATTQHLRAPSTGAAAGAMGAVGGRGQPSQSVSNMRPAVMSSETPTRVKNERQRKAQLAIDAANHSTQQESLHDSPLLRPAIAIKKVSSFFAPPLTASADVSPLLSDDGGLRVMSAYSGQDELADTIRAKSAQVVHLVPAAHRMSVSTAASSEVDNERMLQSAPVSAGHSRETSQLAGERQMATHIYPASAPLTPHESASQEAVMALLQPPKPERALTEGLGATASIATTNTDTRSSMSLPMPSNSSLPSAHFSSTHSSMNELSSLVSSTLIDSSVLLPASSAASRAITAVINSSSSALSAPTFPAPPLASLTGGTLHPKTSISSAVESTASSQSRDSIVHQSLLDSKRSPFLTSRTASSFLPPTEAAAAATVNRSHVLGAHASFESLSSASLGEEARESARGSVMAALAATDTALPPPAVRANGSVSVFPGTPSSLERSHTATNISPDMSPRDGPLLSQPAGLPALIIPHSLAANARARAGSRESELASTPSSMSSVESPTSVLPGGTFRGAVGGGGQVQSADVNQSVHPSHLTNSGIDFSPNTHYRFLLPSPSQLPRDARESRAPLSPRAASNNHNSAGLSSRARQPQATDAVAQPAATKQLTSSPSLLATVLRVRGDSKAPIIPPAASHTATVSPLPDLTATLAATNRRRPRDVVITAHSQRVRTTKMFTYGDAGALLHPPRPWLAKLSLTFITDERLEEEFQKERAAEELRSARFWTLATLCGLVCSSCYEEAVFTRTVHVEVVVWLLRLLSAACQLANLWVLRDERWRAWRQRVSFVSATVWCCTFIINNFLQNAFLTVYGLSILLFSYSIITMFLSLHLSWAALCVLVSLLCWLVTDIALNRRVSPALLFHLSASCLYLGSSYSTEYRDRSSFLRFRRHANEKQTTQNFLANLLPPSVIRSLTLTHSAFIAHERLMADVLFCDVVQFTALAARSSPEDVVAILNVLFSSFDAMTDKYHVYKVETIGDAYLACSGVVEEHADHTKLLVECGLAMRRVTRLFRTPDHQPIVVRIGIHSGFVIAGVVGRKMPRYHLFGETVSIAEEMEQRAPAGQVIISEATLRGMTVEQWKLFDFAPLEPIRIAAPSDTRPPNGSANHVDSATPAVHTTDGTAHVRLIKRYMVRSARSAQLQREREGKATATSTAKRHRMMHARSNTMTSFDRVLLHSTVGGGSGAAAAGSGGVAPLQRATTLKKLNARGSSLIDSELSSVKSSERGKVIAGGVSATTSARSSARLEPSEGHESDVEEKKG